MAAYEESVTIARDLASGEDDMQAQTDLVAVLGDFGDLKRLAGDLAGAGVLYEESLSIVRNVAETTDDVQAQINLVNTLDRVAAASADPVPQYREALDILHGLDAQGS